MERIPVNLRSALQFTAEEIKMYEKLLSACRLHPAPVQASDSALKLWGALEERMPVWGCKWLQGLAGPRARSPPPQMPVSSSARFPHASRHSPKSVVQPKVGGFSRTKQKC